MTYDRRTNPDRRVDTDALAQAFNDGYEKARFKYDSNPDKAALRKALIVAAFMVGIILGQLSGYLIASGSRYMPYCQEDEIILFNIPERNQFWCQHIDNLPPAMIDHLQPVTQP